MDADDTTMVVWIGRKIGSEEEFMDAVAAGEVEFSRKAARESGEDMMNSGYCAVKITQMHVRNYNFPRILTLGGGDDGDSIIEEVKDDFDNITDEPDTKAISCESA